VDRGSQQRGFIWFKSSGRNHLHAGSGDLVVPPLLEADPRLCPWTTSTLRSFFPGVCPLPAMNSQLYGIQIDPTVTHHDRPTK
jgi:hypothetical protein